MSVFNKTDKAGLDSSAKGRWKLEHGLAKKKKTQKGEKKTERARKCVLTVSFHIERKNWPGLVWTSKVDFRKDFFATFYFYTFYKRELETEE